MEQKNEIQTNKAIQLQFIRFLAFLLIFLLHMDDYTFLGGSCQIGTPSGGMMAVSLFFILSGFVTGFSSYGKETKITIKEMKNDIWKKIKKFYPLYILTTFCTVLGSNLPVFLIGNNWDGLKLEIIQLVRNIFLIQSWFTTGFFSYNDVSWFLSSIMWLYLLNVPIKALLNKINKNRRRYIILAVLIIQIILLDIIYLFSIRNMDVSYWGYIFPPSRMGEYISGMILGYIISSLYKKIEHNKRTQIIFTVLEVFAILYYIKSICIMSELLWVQRIIENLIPNFLLLVIFAFGKGYISKLFRKNILKYLGDISFECFLIHNLIIHFYIKIHGNSSPSIIGNIFSIILCLSLTLIFAIIYNKYKRCKLRTILNT